MFLSLVLIYAAHTIRETSVQIAQSVFALDASRRWTVSGTALQNRLADLYGLFRFLRVYPFDDPNTIKALVAQDWPSRPDAERSAKLRMLLSYITLRRPKQLIELPARKDEIHYLTFTADGREHYNNVKGQTIHKIDLALDMSQANNCLNALQ